MKKTLLLFALFINSLYSLSQNKVAQEVLKIENSGVKFKSFSVFTIKNSNDAVVNKVVDEATIVNLNLQKINDIVNQKNENITLEIPYNNNTIEIKLYKVNPFAEGFHVDTNFKKNIAYEKGVYYRGIINGDYTSVVSFNFFKDECNGIISASDLGNIVVGKLDKPQNTTEYIIYSDSKMKVKNDFDCFTKDALVDTHNEEDGRTTNRDGLSTRCVTVYFEVDYNLFTQNGSSTTTTTNWVTSVFNNVQTLYNNDGMTVALKSMYIWTVLDPYDGIGSSSSDYLYAFNNQRPVFDGDVGQLIGIDPGGLGGVAVTINGLCNSNNFSYSDVNSTYLTVPTYSWTVQVITHEFGHLLGSPHTHACVWNGNNTAIDNCAPYALGSSWEGGSCMTSPPTIPSSTVKGTIMSYCHLVSGVGISFNNGFGTQPSNRILTAVNAGPCLSIDCINTCINTVATVSVNMVSTNSAVITWDDLGSNNSWQVAVYPFGGTPTTWNNVSTNTYSVSGLTPNAYYVASVRPLCSGGLSSNGRDVIFMTSGSFCSGVTFTDTGGSSSNYGDMQTVVRTIIPDISTNSITLSFSSFEFELDYDYLYVYDGNSTAAPLLGQYTGSSIPGPFTSTAVDGSLTVKYTSDQYLNYSGFIANIGCVTNLNTTNVQNYLDFTYFPNPTNGNVTIVSKTPFNSLKIYNVTGQLLYSEEAQHSSTTVDISSFATGTYFFKINFEDKEANFKILKE